MVVHFVRACVGPVRECCRRRFVTLRGEALQFTIHNLLRLVLANYNNNYKVVKNYNKNENTYHIKHC